MKAIKYLAFSVALASFVSCTQTETYYVPYQVEPTKPAATKVKTPVKKPVTKPVVRPTESAENFRAV
jgi:hypothetical protein